MSKKVFIAMVAVVIIVSGVIFGVAYFVARNMQSNKNATYTTPPVNTAPETTNPNSATPSLPVTETPATNTPESAVKACTQEAKLCSDGSYVGRTGPNCEFSACPIVQVPVVQAKTYTINIASFAFSPNSITINKGDTVVWTNNDSVKHTATGSGFDSGLLNNNQSFSFKFNNIGTYNYICTPHPSMKGTVIVK
jgi:plastocyanin